MSETSPTPAEAIADYLKAWGGDEGREPPFIVEYERGWVCWRYPGSFLHSRKRVRQLVEMTARIRGRSALAGATQASTGK